MLSYLSDITDDMAPLEAGLGKLCDMERDVGCLGWAARCEKAEPRQIRPIEIEGGPLPPMEVFWKVSDGAGQTVGRISSACRAFSYDCNAAIGLIDRSHWDAGTSLFVHAPDGERRATIKSKFWGR